MNWMPIFAIQGWCEDGVESSNLLSVLLIRIRVDVEQRDDKHPEDQPQDRKNAKPPHAQPHHLSKIFNGHNVEEPMPAA